MKIKELSNDQRRQLLDTQQVFETYEAAKREEISKYSGSLQWSERDGRSYLISKRKKVTKSLGPRSPETERIKEEFEKGRLANEQRLDTLNGRLKALARANVEMGLGRVPSITARICRRLNQAGLFEDGVRVVGTNALFAYEAAAGVQIESGLLATGDIDLLVDVRQKMRMMGEVTPTLRELIQKVDPSFKSRHNIEGDYQVVNDEGFAVEVVRPMDKDEMSSSRRQTATPAKNDMKPAALVGMNRLADAPAFTAIAIDENGYPVRLTAPDPRSFGLAKAWLADRPDRNPIKAPRDRGQSEVVLDMVEKYFPNLAESGVAHLPSDWRQKLETAMQDRRDRRTAVPPAPEPEVIITPKNQPSWF